MNVSAKVAAGILLILAPSGSPLVTLSRAQGSLTPAGAPAPTMKSLDQLDEKLNQASAKLDQVDAKQNVADAKAEKRTPIGSLPFTINAPGSYYLTGNLSSSSATATGITISASDVTIDLMGFLLRNSVPTTGNGIQAADTVQNITVRNGSVTGWATGISLFAANVRVERITARANTGIGIISGVSSVIVDCVAALNGSTGMRAGAQSAVVRCVARENAGVGIQSNGGGLVSQSVSKGNAGDGINLGDTGIAQECAAYENGADGFEALSSGAIITRCTAGSNGGNGIRVNNASFVLENSCRGNGVNSVGAGILVSATDNRIEGNHLVFNDRGIDVDFAGNLLIRNSATGNTTADYEFVANNVFGAIVDRRSPSSAAVNTATTASVASSAGTTDPWANFVY
jgi:parallel beta-helix repeat protein